MAGISTHLKFKRGEAEARAQDTYKRKILRYKKRMQGLTAEGTVWRDKRSSNTGGNSHPLDCICYDCLWGEEGDAKREARGLPPRTRRYMMEYDGEEMRERVRDPMSHSRVLRGALSS